MSSPGKSQTHSLVFNLFRKWEQIFGRKRGVRAECRTQVTRDENGKVTIEREFYTFESLFVYLEYCVREFFEKFKLSPVRIEILRGVSPNGTYFYPHLLLAVAYDNASSSNANAATLNFSHTSSGSDRTLCFGGDNDGSPGRDITAVTYAAVNLTQYFEQRDNASNLQLEGWYKIGQSSGTNTVSVTASGGSLACGVVSFSGSNQIEIGTKSNTNGSGLTASVSLTTTKANSMIFGTAGCQTQTLTANGTNQTERYTNFVGATALRCAGSTQTTTAIGSYTSSWALNGSTSWAAGVIEIKEPPTTYTATLTESFSFFDLITAVLTPRQSAYTFIRKPLNGIYTKVKNGFPFFDDAAFSYDDSSAFFDGDSPQAYTKLPKPTSSVYTKIPKPN